LVVFLLFSNTMYIHLKYLIPLSLYYVNCYPQLLSKDTSLQPVSSVDLCQEFTFHTHLTLMKWCIVMNSTIGLPSNDDIL